jgi:SAM-dependent methyltransferase
MEIKSAHTLRAATSHYDVDPEKYIANWCKVSASTVWASCLDLFRKPPCRLIDIGAGSKRDPVYFHTEGYEVTAVEPSQRLREHGKADAPDLTWVNSAFPALEDIGGPFEMVTVSAGFVHVSEEDQLPSLRSIHRITVPKGRVAISLRHPHDPLRVQFPTNPDSFVRWSKGLGFIILRDIRDQPDPLKRRDVQWNYLVLERP